jgi:hypothetical protein
MWELFPGTARLHEKSNNPAQLSQSVTTHWPTNINVVPIDYAFRPRLRDRLTLGLTATLSFTVFVVTHVSIRTSDTSRMPHGCPFDGLRNAPLPRIAAPKASARGLSPGTSSARKPLIRPVSCYAFFKGWLLLSQPPGCFGISTSFPT